MRLPLPTNRIVALTLVGALLTAVVAGMLATPGVLPTTGDDTATLGSDAPIPNESFTPAVSDGGNGGNYEEHEDEDEHEGEEEHEYEDEEYDALDRVVGS